jgi:hypothetical protein
MIPLSAFVSTGLPYSVKRGNNYVITAPELAQIPVFDGLEIHGAQGDGMELSLAEMRISAIAARAGKRIAF